MRGSEGNDVGVVMEATIDLLSQKEEHLLPDHS